MIQKDKIAEILAEIDSKRKELILEYGKLREKYGFSLW